MFIALDQAIFKRLSGSPLDKNGNPKDPRLNPGVQIPVYSKTLGNDPKDFAFNSFRVIPNRYRQIPIYKHSVSGVDWRQVYPCVAYDYVSFKPHLNQWLPPVSLNQLVRMGKGPTTTVVNALGNAIGTGKSQLVANPLPESYDVVLQIDIYGLIEFEVYAIMRSVMLLLPQKGSIYVPLSDGTEHPCDLLLQGVDKITGGEPTLTGTGGQQGATREYRVTMTYVVESYMDTTYTYLEQTVPAVTSVQLERGLAGQGSGGTVDANQNLDSIDLNRVM